MLAISIMSLALVGVTLIWTVHDPLLVVPLGRFMGLTAQGEGALLNRIVAHYFGRGHYGKISGAMQPFSFVGLGSGPLFVSRNLQRLQGLRFGVLPGLRLLRHRHSADSFGVHAAADATGSPAQ